MRYSADKVFAWVKNKKIENPELRNSNVKNLQYTYKKLPISSLNCQLSLDILNKLDATTIWLNLANSGF